MLTVKVAHERGVPKSERCGHHPVLESGDHLTTPGCPPARRQRTVSARGCVDRMHRPAAPGSLRRRIGIERHDEKVASAGRVHRRAPKAEHAPVASSAAAACVVAARHPCIREHHCNLPGRTPSPRASRNCPVQRIAQRCELARGCGACSAVGRRELRLLQTEVGPLLGCLPTALPASSDRGESLRGRRLYFRANAPRPCSGFSPCCQQRRQRQQRQQRQRRQQQRWQRPRRQQRRPRPPAARTTRSGARPAHARARDRVCARGTRRARARAPRRRHAAAQEAARPARGVCPLLARRRPPSTATANRYESQT